jgi:hypothetical protein
MFTHVLGARNRGVMAVVLLPVLLLLHSAGSPNTLLDSGRGAKTGFCIAIFAGTASEIAPITQTCIAVGLVHGLQQRRSMFNGFRNNKALLRAIHTERRYLLTIMQICSTQPLYGQPTLDQDVQPELATDPMGEASTGWCGSCVI